MTHAEDLDLWIRLMLLGGHAHYVDAILGDYRVRPGSASGNSGRMLMGNIKVYQKARTSLPESRPEMSLLDRLIAENSEALAFEHAIDRVIDGDARGGIHDLRSASALVGGPVWTLAFVIWRMFPGLARPMLRRRRRAHQRGMSQASMLASIATCLGY